MTILDYLRNYVKYFPSKIVYRYVDRNASPLEKITYSQLWCNTKNIAAHFKVTTTSRSRVLLLLPTESSFIQFFLGTILADMIAVPCPIGYSESGINRILNIIKDCGATTIVTNNKTYKMLFKRGTAASEQLKMLPIKWEFAEDFLVNSLQVVTDMTPLEEDSIAYLQYTSGSTSLPKGVMITHQNVLKNLEAIDDVFGRKSTDTSVTWLPHYHDMGLVDGLLSPLFTGGTGIIIAPLDFVSRPSVWLSSITRYAASHTGGPNFGIELCTRRITDEEYDRLDLSSLRILYVGAEPVNYNNLKNFANRFSPIKFFATAFVPAYGLAESTLAVSLHHSTESLFLNKIPENLTKAVLGCGPPVLHTQVQIVSPDSLQIVNGSQGEIWVSGGSVAKGYWNN